jgi:hypothetical protein
MSSSGAVTLGDITNLRMLEVACSRCDRHGRLSVAKLIGEHGAEAKITNLRQIISADYPRLLLRPFTSAAACITRSSSQP